MSIGASTSDPVQALVHQVRAAFGVARLDAVDVVEITGPDAVRFLQNRLSNDVNALSPGSGQRNAVLDRQAKIQGVFDLYRLTDRLLMVIDSRETANAIAQIEKYRIVEQLSLQKITNAVVLIAQGPNAPEFIGELVSSPENAPLPTKEYNWIYGQLFDCPVTVIARSLSGESGFLLLVETEQSDIVAEQFFKAATENNGVILTPQALETLRVEAGLPAYGSEYDFDTLLPETGLERDAVSYSKGCYLGQETIARVKTYGMLQKALVGLKFEQGVPLPEAGQHCLLDGKDVGHLCSVLDSPTLERPIGMAYLGKTERVPGKRLQLTIGTQIYAVEVGLLPLYQSRYQRQDAQQLLQEGLKLFSDGYDEEAIKTLRQAVEVNPELLEAYEALGVILSRHERFDEAIALMEKVLQLDPEHVLAHTNLSVFYMKIGDKEKAEDEKAKATMAAFSKKAKESGLVFDIEAERRKKEQAALDKIAMFQEALSFNPADPLGNFGLGSVFLELKRFDEAIAPFEKTLEAQPKHSVAYLSLGKALEGAGHPDRAREAYQQGIEVAAAKGDLMPLKEMQSRLENLK